MYKGNLKISTERVFELVSIDLFIFVCVCDFCLRELLSTHIHIDHGVTQESWPITSSMKNQKEVYKNFQRINNKGNCEMIFLF